jgi:hypothetical protein
MNGLGGKPQHQLKEDGGISDILVSVWRFADFCCLEFLQSGKSTQKLPSELRYELATYL